VRLVVDTNVLISALLASASLPAHLVLLWREGRFDFLTSSEHRALAAASSRQMIESRCITAPIFYSGKEKLAWTLLI
jgi:predicted nucleic acid-binding protein